MPIENKCPHSRNHDVGESGFCQRQSDEASQADPGRVGPGRQVSFKGLTPIDSSPRSDRRQNASASEREKVDIIYLPEGCGSMARNRRSSATVVRRHPRGCFLLAG